MSLVIVAAKSPKSYDSKIANSCANASRSSLVILFLGVAIGVPFGNPPPFLVALG